MTSAQIEIMLIAVAVAVACAVPGTFLVLRRMALMSDAISHAILFGIVIAFFVVEDLASPLLIVAAALTGVLTVTLVELINRTGLVKEDAAIGLVFPLLFSVGVLLISRFAGNLHLDTHIVLLGELAFAPFERFEVAGQDLGPQALWVMGGIGLLNVLFVVLFFKELKLATFDAGLAAALGFSPWAIHYALMSLVSLTAVGAFDAVGAILVVALMIAPPAAAFLLTERLSIMVALSAVLGAVAAVAGYWLARWFDVSIAGSMATAAGAVFATVFVLAPRRGLLANLLRRRRQRWDFAQTMLAIHLYQHEELPEAAQENRETHLSDHLRWQPAFAKSVVGIAEDRGVVRRSGDGFLELTDVGRERARGALVHSRF